MDGWYSKPTGNISAAPVAFAKPRRRQPLILRTLPLTWMDWLSATFFIKYQHPPPPQKKIPSVSVNDLSKSKYSPTGERVGGTRRKLACWRGLQPWAVTFIRFRPPRQMETEVTGRWCSWHHGSVYVWWNRTDVLQPPLKLVQAWCWGTGRSLWVGQVWVGSACCDQL